MNRRALRITLTITVFATIAYVILHQIAVGICQELNGSFNYSTGCCQGFRVGDGGSLVESESWYRMVNWLAVVIAVVISAVGTQVLYRVVTRALAWIGSAQRSRQ